MSIGDMAVLVKKVVEEEFPEKRPIPIETAPSDDIRSYHINSSKIKRVLDFEPRHSIDEAVRELCMAFREGKLPRGLEDDRYFNVRRLKQLKAS
jgi:nucleoside-diphosphate-sugar epimerase